MTGRQHCYCIVSKASSNRSVFVSVCLCIVVLIICQGPGLNGGPEATCQKLICLVSSGGASSVALGEVKYGWHWCLRETLLVLVLEYWWQEWKQYQFLGRIVEHCITGLLAMRLSFTLLIPDGLVIN